MGRHSLCVALAPNVQCLHAAARSPLRGPGLQLSAPLCVGQRKRHLQGRPAPRGGPHLVCPCRQCRRTQGHVRPPDSTLWQPPKSCRRPLVENRQPAPRNNGRFRPATGQPIALQSPQRPAAKLCRLAPKRAHLCGLGRVSLCPKRTVRQPHARPAPTGSAAPCQGFRGRHSAQCHSPKRKRLVRPRGPAGRGLSGPGL